MKNLLLSIMLMTVAVGTTTAQEVISTVPAQTVVRTVPAQEVVTKVPEQEVTTTVPVQVGDMTLPAQVVTTVPAQDVVTNLPAQEVTAVVPAQVAVATTPAPCDFTPVNHWSIGIKGGANYFRVVPGGMSRGDLFHFILGGTVEYTINPLVGLGLEYTYNPYGHSYQLNATQTGQLEGRTHDVLMYGSINLANLLIPFRTNFWSKMNIYGDAGVGVGFYQFKLSDQNNNLIVDSRNSGDGVPETMMAKLGLNVEYNLSKSIALGGEVQYRYYDRANLGGVNWSKGNCEALTASVGLRFKFGATGNKQHARNITMCEYYPRPAPVIIEKIVKDNTQETMDRLKAIEDENAALNDKINKLNDQIVVLTTNNQGEVIPSTYQNVEFEFGSDKLTRSSYSTLDQIAVTLKNNPATVKLNIAGYTDYIGTEEYNQTLSVKRANAVKLYLKAKHVPASSVIITGYGEHNPIAPNETREGRQKNRRVEFKMTK